uniref:PPUP7475 n=1 Tax=Poeciliopsis prolifica TaxID=188132 RepID=A0A0S7EX57_9TELE
MLQLITCSASVLWMNNAQLRYPAAPRAILLHASEAPDATATAAGRPAKSLRCSSNSPYMHSLMQIQVYVKKQRICMNLLQRKERRNRRDGRAAGENRRADLSGWMRGTEDSRGECGGALLCW